MKTTIFQSVFCILVFATTVLSSCQKEVMTTTGSVSGQILSGTGNGIGNPVPGVKLYLWNLSIKLDTVNYKNNLKAIADSTVTDNTGKYAIINIPEGKWGISPVFDQTDSKVNLDTSGDSVIFSIPGKKKDYNVNFLMSHPHNGVGTFHIRFIVKNPRYLYFESIRTTYYPVTFILYSPIYTYQYFYEGQYKYIDISFEYGSFWDGISNIFSFKFYYPDASPAILKLVVGWNFTLSTCPANSTFEVDLDAKTWKWVKNSIDW